MIEMKKGDSVAKIDENDPKRDHLIEVFTAKGYELVGSAEAEVVETGMLEERAEFFDAQSVEDLTLMCESHGITPGDEWKKSDFVEALAESSYPLE